MIGLWKTDTGVLIRIERKVKPNHRRYRRRFKKGRIPYLPPGVAHMWVYAVVDGDRRRLQGSKLMHPVMPKVGRETILVSWEPPVIGWVRGRVWLYAEYWEHEDSTESTMSIFQKQMVQEIERSLLNGLTKTKKDSAMPYIPEALDHAITSVRIPTLKELVQKSLKEREP